MYVPSTTTNSLANWLFSLSILLRISFGLELCIINPTFKYFHFSVVTWVHIVRMTLL